MKVLVVGANGQIGHQVVEKLKDKGHGQVAMVLKEEQTKQFEDKVIDTVIFAAGSGGNTGPDMTIVIDQEGAIETIDNAKNAGVKHFVIASSTGADANKAENKVYTLLEGDTPVEDLFKWNSDMRTISSQTKVSCVFYFQPSCRMKLRTYLYKEWLNEQ